MAKETIFDARKEFDEGDKGFLYVDLYSDGDPKWHLAIVMGDDDPFDDDGPSLYFPLEDHYVCSSDYVDAPWFDLIEPPAAPPELKCEYLAVLQTGKSRISVTGRKDEMYEAIYKAMRFKEPSKR